ncbi:hypothetical protein [Kitasatospora sp. GP82]|uniref:hypothetical protein n=1 Tax=Kitasatospora sp. GP82 TaxID=3035089 RepID=UPI00247686EB|nr:hypothetical protein [Kitasatospora sp. GP82]MDH6129775.1 hypothetical protein [Kitasatospora sp. GP82]
MAKRHKYRGVEPGWVVFKRNGDLIRVRPKLEGLANLEQVYIELLREDADLRGMDFHQYVSRIVSMTDLEFAAFRGALPHRTAVMYEAWSTLFFYACEQQVLLEDKRGRPYWLG